MNVQIITTAGTDRLALQDVEVMREDRYYGSPTTEAIDGHLWSNFDNFITKVTISYNASIEVDRWRAVLNNIAADILAGKSSVVVVIDGQQLAVVPEANFIGRWKYSQTIGYYVPSVTFNAAVEGVPIGALYVNEGYVNQGYV